MTKKAYMTIQAGNAQPERLDLVLYHDSVPRTVANFCHYLQASDNKGYKNSTFHRIIKGFMAQGGDFLNSDGTGSTSIYGKTFPDENFLHRHLQPGTLSMANSGKDTNGSQFFITFRPTPHLDGKHVVFGHVDLSTPESLATLERLEAVRTVRDDKPHSPVRIVDCGVEEEEEEEEPENKHQEVASVKTTDTIPEEEEEDSNELELPESEDEEPPKTKAEAIKRRMRKLKLKMNQARQLNKQEVLKEGERLTSVEGATAVRKRQIRKDKKMNEADWKAKNSKAFGVAAAHGIDGKHLVQQADSSLKAAFKKKAKAKANRFEMQDYYNSEGQHRNYERNLKSLVTAAAPLDDAHNSTETFNPIAVNNASDEARERAGARNLATEMKRRIEKQAKKKRERMEFEETDVSYINSRNKRFNQKISRNFDKSTAEIRQNLERGTAL
ncbi:unnamed protein product [Cylindrotheca closterium]|uniref:peptidylprolyl isomerase n=1 Tax=Cylindrotheca closterium TaxID=2856 RepID=A0AAD2GDM6_9STRA|nr:unnamed protein product [Cylindrotheca closterium]